MLLRPGPRRWLRIHWSRSFRRTRTLGHRSRRMPWVEADKAHPRLLLHTSSFLGRHNTRRGCVAWKRTKHLYRERRVHIFSTDVSARYEPITSGVVYIGPYGSYSDHVYVPGFSIIEKETLS